MAKEALRMLQSKMDKGIVMVHTKTVINKLVPCMVAYIYKGQKAFAFSSKGKCYEFNIEHIREDDITVLSYHSTFRGIPHTSLKNKAAIKKWLWDNRVEDRWADLQNIF